MSDSDDKQSEQEMPLTVESILENLGGYSWFQFMITMILISPEIPAAMIAISPVLTGSSNLDYQCQTLNATFSLSKDDICGAETCLDGNITAGKPPFTSIVQEWDLHCGRAWITDTITSIQMAGSMAGALLCAIAADRFGRKPVFFSLCLIMGTFGSLAGFANSVYIFGISRLMAGFAVGGMYIVYLNYLMEFLTPDFRTICGCLSFWAIGEILLGFFGYLFHGWRHLSWATSTPAFVILLAYWFLPESPRWLLCQGRTDEAISVFNKIAWWNRKPAVDPETVKRLELLIMQQLQSDPSPEKSKPTFQNMLRMLVHHKHMLIFMWAWFAISFVYNGITFNIKALSGDPNLNVLFLGISDIPASLTGLMLNNRLGRRRTFMTLSFLSAVLLTSFAIMKQIQLVDNYPALTYLIFTGRYSTNACYAILACFTAESFPTTSRATFMGICSFCASIAGIFAPQLAFLSTLWSPGPYLVFCSVTILTSVASLGLKETTGRPLKDMVDRTTQSS